jgi:hypothetical protein
MIAKQKQQQTEERIKFYDTMESVLLKMSEGNPGAITVLTRLLKESEDIDPQDMLGGLGKILYLDTLQIYGSRIWVLYKDVCGENLSKMVAVLRSVQLGDLSEKTIHHAIDNRGEGVDTDKIMKAVKASLEKFDRKEEGVT